MKHLIPIRSYERRLVENATKMYSRKMPRIDRLLSIYALCQCNKLSNESKSGKTTLQKVWHVLGKRLTCTHYATINHRYLLLNLAFLKGIWNLYLLPSYNFYLISLFLKFVFITIVKFLFNFNFFLFNLISKIYNTLHLFHNLFFVERSFYKKLVKNSLLRVYKSVVAI